MSTQWALGGSLLWAPFRHLHLLRSSHPSFHWMAALVQSIQTQRGTQRGTLCVCVCSRLWALSPSLPATLVSVSLPLDQCRDLKLKGFRVGVGTVAE